MDYNGFKRIIVDESRFSGSINIHNWDLSMEDVASGNFTPFLLEIMLNSNSIGKITGTFPGFNCCVAVLGPTLWDGAKFSTRRRVVDSGVPADRDIDAALAVISRHVLRSKNMCKVQQCPWKHWRFEIYSGIHMYSPKLAQLLYHRISKGGSVTCAAARPAGTKLEKSYCSTLTSKTRVCLQCRFQPCHSPLGVSKVRPRWRTAYFGTLEVSAVPFPWIVL